MRRLLSHTEITKALTCQAQWDFAYGGHLAGTALKAKRTAPRLQEGRAWGAGVAAFQAHHGELFAMGHGLNAITASLVADAERQKEFGYHDPMEQLAMDTRLATMLAHHAELAEQFRVEALEHEIVVPIPSRTGVNRSSKYSFLAYVDAFSSCDYRDGELWLVEYKLRDTLSDYRLVANDRQIRRYAWAFAQATGLPVDGVLVVERLNAIPRAPKVVNARRKADGIDGKVPSHDKAQVTTAELYLALCRQYGEEPHSETADALAARIWHKSYPVMLRPGELEEAGQELVSAAKLIADLDSGRYLPVRNVRPANCNGCFFRDICPNPGDPVVDELYERTVPKRDRPAQDEAEPTKEAIAA